MGLFDLAEKVGLSALGAKDESDNSESGERASVFKGDLAHIGKSSAGKKPEPAHVAPAGIGLAAESKDSADSSVFMSFQPIEKGYWICSECGTCNDENQHDCIVCGCDSTVAIASEDVHIDDQNKTQPETQKYIETELQRKIQEAKDNSIKRQQEHLKHEREWEEFKRRESTAKDNRKDILRTVAWILIGIIFFAIVTSGMR